MLAREGRMNKAVQGGGHTVGSVKAVNPSTQMIVQQSEYHHIGSRIAEVCTYVLLNSKDNYKLTVEKTSVLYLYFFFIGETCFVVLAGVIMSSAVHCIMTNKNNNRPKFLNSVFLY